MTAIDVLVTVALVVAIVMVVFMIVTLNNLNNTLAKLEESSRQLRDEGLSAFRDLKQLVADADAELDKVDLVLDRADQATTVISETSKKTHEAVHNPILRTIAIASGSSQAAKSWFKGKGRLKKSNKLLPKNGIIDLE